MTKKLTFNETKQETPTSISGGSMSPEEKGNQVSTIEITPTKEKKLFSTSKDIKGVKPLYFRYKGKGNFSLYSLTFND